MPTSAAALLGTLPKVISTTDDWVAPGFGTVDASLVFVNRASDGNNPSDHSTISVGAHDDAGNVCLSLRSRDAVSTSATAMIMRDDYAAWLYVHNGNNLRAGRFSAIADGLRMETVATNETNIPGDVFGSGLAFSGLLNHAVGTQALSGATPVTVNLGFPADLVFFFYHWFNLNSSTSAASRVSFGVAHNNGVLKQHAIVHSPRAGVSHTEVYNEIRDGVVGIGSNAAGGEPNILVTAQNFTSTGFQLVANTGTSSVVSYMAVQLADPGDAHVAIIDSATDAGPQPITTGFQPDAVMLLGARNTALSTRESDGGFFVGVGDAVRQRCLSVADRHDVPVTETFSPKADVIVEQRTDANVVDAVASLQLGAADSYTLNYSQGGAQVNKWLSVAVGDSTGVPPEPTGNPLVMLI